MSVREKGEGVAQLDWGEGPFEHSPALAEAHSAVLAAPLDREALQVFADLAAEEGHPHGEMVRLGLLKETLEGDAKRLVEEAEEELEARYARAIFPCRFDRELTTQTGGMRLGFDREAIIRDHAHLVRLRDVTPLDTFTVPDASTIEPIIASGALRGARSITCPGHLALPVLQSLAEEIAQLEELHLLSVNRYSKEVEVAPLAEVAPHLKAISLEGLRADSWVALSELPALESLEVNAPQIKDADVARSLDGFPKLRDLTVRFAGELPSLMTLVASRSVETLTLQSMRLRARNRRSCFAPLHGSALRKLTLRSFDFADADGAIGDLELPHLTHLEVLARLGPNPTAFVEGPLVARVNDLSLHKTQMSGDAFIALLRNNAPALSSLSLRGQRFPDQGAALAQLPFVERMETLYLGDNIDLDVAPALSRASRLRDLHCTSSSRAVVRALIESPAPLRSLGLHGLPSSDETERDLIELLGASATAPLRELSLSGVGFSSAMVDLLRRPRFQWLTAVGIYVDESDIMTRLFDHRARSHELWELPVPERPFWRP